MSCHTSSTSTNVSYPLWEVAHKSFVVFLVTDYHSHSSVSFLSWKLKFIVKSLPPLYLFQCRSWKSDAVFHLEFNVLICGHIRGAPCPVCLTGTSVLSLVVSWGFYESIFFDTQTMTTNFNHFVLCEQNPCLKEDCVGLCCILLVEWKQLMNISQTNQDVGNCKLVHKPIILHSAKCVHA